MSPPARLFPFSLTKGVILRLVLLLIFGLASVWFGFFAIPPGKGMELFKNYGYLITLLTVGIWLALVIRSCLSDLAHIRSHWREAAALALVILSLILIYRWAEPPGFNIVNDEPSFAAISNDIHLHQRFGLPLVSERPEGKFTITASNFSKRPYLYPFVVASLHELTGYRLANTWLTNHLLAAGILALLYIIGRRIAGWRGGLLALLYFGSLPLFAHSSVGAGLDLLNTFFLLLLLLLGIRYLEDPQAMARAGALAITGVLAGQSRTESIIMVLPASLLIIWGWIKGRAVVLPASILICPFLLIPTAWHLRIFQTNRDYFEYLGDAQPFGIHYLFGGNGEKSNLLNAFEFYLAPAPIHAMAWPLTVSALLAWALAGWWMMRRRSLPASMTAALSIWAGGIVLHWIIIHCYYWGRLNDPVASRFALPSLLLLALGAPIALAIAPESRRHHLNAAFLTASLAIFFMVSLPLIFFRNYDNHLPLTQETKWALDWAEGKDKETLLILDKRPLPWIASEYAVLDPALAPAEIGSAMKRSAYQEVYAIQRIILDPETNLYYEEDKWALPKGWRQAELQAQANFDPYISIRIYRVVPTPE